MNRNGHNVLAITVVGCAVLCAAVPAAASPWRLVLPDTVEISGGSAWLRDVARGPVPAAAGEVLLHAGAAPNTSVMVSRRMILRRLVSAGLGGGVSFGGAEATCLVFQGRELDGRTVAVTLRRELQALVPKPVPGAPDSWLDVEIPEMRLAAVGDWQLHLKRSERLTPGRNLVPVQLEAGPHREAFTASVVLHSFDETARAVRGIDRDTPLAEAQFAWEWQDLSALPAGVAAGRLLLAGASATRSIAAGDLLRLADVKETPAILAGDEVELMVVRGQVAVSVRATARQPGCVGQTIPVRSELTGRLVNARVTGPGLVEWRR
ncbi:flagellar basal body P-ring formation protein FlgA [bacterium]|nr:flagellar basal body P-ring formation protein FlgA [bacterium]